MIPYVNTDTRTHMSLKYFEKKNPEKKGSDFRSPPH